MLFSLLTSVAGAYKERSWVLKPLAPPNLSKKKKNKKKNEIIIPNHKKNNPNMDVDEESFFQKLKYPKSSTRVAMLTFLYICAALLLVAAVWVAFEKEKNSGSKKNIFGNMFLAFLFPEIYLLYAGITTGYDKIENRYFSKITP